MLFCLRHQRRVKRVKRNEKNHWLRTHKLLRTKNEDFEEEQEKPTIEAENGQ